MKKPSNGSLAKNAFILSLCPTPPLVLTPCKGLHCRPPVPGAAAFPLY